MAIDPRFSQAGSPQVIQVGGSSPPWLLAAVLGLLMLQMSLVGLLAWKMLTPSETDGKSDKQAAALTEAVQKMAESRSGQAEMEAQLRVLDQVVSQFAQGGQPNPISLLSRKQLELDEAKQALRAFQSRETSLTADVASAKRDQTRLEDRSKVLETMIDSLEKDRGDLKEAVADREKKLAALKKEFGIEGENAEGSEESTRWRWYLVGGAAVLLFIAAGVGAAVSARREREQAEFLESDPVLPTGPPPSAEHAPTDDPPPDPPVDA